ncbi:MAG: ATP-grasp domain-containing protein [bacterium]
MDNKIGILITGAGAPGAPGIIYCLRKANDDRLRLIGVDIDKDAVGFSIVDAHYVIPPPESDDFISSIMNICKRENIRAILPLVTRELVSLSRIKFRLKEMGIYIPISDEKTIEVLNNKHTLTIKAKELGVPIPQFRLAENLDELIAYVNELGYPKKPVCIKLPVSNGMRGFRVFDSSRDKMEMLIKEKPTGVFTTLEEFFIKFHDCVDKFPPYIVMEHLSGNEYTIDSLANNGKMLVCIPRLRERIKNGISFNAKVVKDERLIEMTGRLIEGLGIDGVVGFQFKEKENGTPCLIESNPRLQGTVILSACAGVNIPYLLVKMGLGETYEVGEVKWGMSIKRYWGWMFFDEEGLPYTF